MDYKITSKKVKVFTHTSHILDFGNDIKVREKFINGELQSQEWFTTDLSVSHPSANKEYTKFQYFDDISFLITANNMHDIDYPVHSLVFDWNEFKGFDYVVNFGISLDGLLHQINSARAIGHWHSVDYSTSTSLDNSVYNLHEVLAFLSGRPTFRNVRIEKIPHYNSYDDRTHAIAFDFLRFDKHFVHVMTDDAEIADGLAKCKLPTKVVIDY